MANLAEIVLTLSEGALSSDNLEAGVVESEKKVDLSQNMLPPSIEYTVAAQPYGPSLDIEQLWYGNKTATISTFEPEDEYWTFTAAADVEEEMITAKEAQDSFQQIQYEAAAKSIGTVSFEDRRKFDFWIKFNSALFGVFQTVYAVTSDVNYAPPR